LDQQAGRWDTHSVLKIVYDGDKKGDEK